MRFDEFASPSAAFYWLGQQCACSKCAEPVPVRKEPQQEAAPEPELPAVERCAFAVLDTETSGLSATDVVIQLAVGLYDESGKALQFYDRLWKLPRGVRISKRAHAVHQIGYARLRAHGMDPAPQMRRVSQLLDRLRQRDVRIVAHNAKFDVRLLRQTATAHGVAEWDLGDEDVFCTMRASRTSVGAVSRRTGRVKDPGNVELHRFLFQKAPQCGALHDALTDIKVTARCYVGGKARGWW